MSQFCGKCDFADFISISGLDHVLQSKIYMGRKIIDAKDYRDLIPYLAHIVVASVGSYIRISEDSYVDRSEKETLELYLQELLTIYRKCKKNGKKFKVEDAVEKVRMYDHNLEALTELANRVKLHGNKATIDGVHTEIHEYYRNQLVNEMLKYGLDPVDYGYGRFIYDRVPKSKLKDVNND